MSLVDQVIAKHLERENLAVNWEAKAKEVKRFDDINALPLDQFHELPREDQRVAEEIWTAKVLDANIRREESRRERLFRELEAAG